MIVKMVSKFPLQGESFVDEGRPGLKYHVSHLLKM